MSRKVETLEKVELTSLQTVQEALRRTGHVISHPIRQALEDVFLFPRSNKATQLMLLMKYKEMQALGVPLPTFDEVEFRAYSQFGEDGILLYLFSLLGTTNKKCVEICGGGGFDNTTNLIVNHGWNGLFFDGCESYLRHGRQFFSRCADTKMWPPRMVQAWITAENVNDLLREQGYCGEIDLLSLDMDGMDYWIWRAIDVVQPRVVVLEYNTALGPNDALTIPYQSQFTTSANKISAFGFFLRRVLNTLMNKPIADRIDHYYGASLAAFVKLGKEKGYRLVGCERFSYNAFFVRNDLGSEIFSEVEVAVGFTHPFAQYVSTVRKHTVRHKVWVEV